MQSIGVSVVVLVLAASVAVAQSNPADFSGTWKMDADRSESAHQDVPIGPVTVVIIQTAADVIIETTRKETGKAAPFHEVLTYKLDDSETTNTGSAAATVTSKAHWDGAKLVTQTTRNIRDSTVTTVYIYSLTAGGREMVIDKTLTVQHGYQFQGSRTTGRGTDVFVKTAK